MPLRKFSLNDVGAIRSAECSDVPELMVVAGPNGVGKSTMFEEVSKAIESSRRSEANIEVDEETKSVYLSPHRAPAPSDMSASLLSSLGRESARSRLGSLRYNINSNEVPNVLQYSDNTRSRKSADFAPYFELKKRLAQLEFDRGQLMAEIYDEQGSIPEGAVPDFGEPLKKGIDAVLPGLEYKGVRQTDDHDYDIQFNDRSGSVIEFDDLSSGEKDSISLIFNLVEKKIESRIDSIRGEEPSQEDLVVIIDSPEAYLHPAMQERFLSFVQDELESTGSHDSTSTLQVLMCTHSQTIIQNISDESLYFLLYQDQREDNQLVSAEGISIETLESITGELGVTALSAGNPIVLVEGRSDREVLRKLFPEKREEIEILPMGGKGKIISFSNSFNKIVPELYSKGIYLFAIVDRDRDIDIDDRYSDFVHQLSVTCIENHLLDTDALFEALETLVSEEELEARGLSAPSDIESLIADIVETDKFREQEIKTRLNEQLRINIHINDFDEVTGETVSERIDAVTSTKKERISELIGDTRDDVSESITNQNYGRLNGKIIVTQMASEFDLQSDVLVRTTAKIVGSNDSQPESLTAIFEEITDTVDDTTPASLIETIE